MIIAGKTYTNKMEAGKAILALCKNMPTPTVLRAEPLELFETIPVSTAQRAEPKKIGSYCGFDMSVHFNFNVSTMELKGAMSYSIELGTNALININHINDSLSEIPERIKAEKKNLENLYNQLDYAKEELKKPFSFENELAEKSQRLAFLTAQLSVDVNEQSVEKNGTEPEITVKKEKLSILETLNTYKEDLAINQKSNEKSAVLSNITL